MGHRAHKFSILQDGTARHTLDDAAGGGDQVRVRHGEHQFPAVTAVVDDLQNFHIIGAHFVPLDIGQNRGRPCFHLRRRRHRQRFTLLPGSAVLLQAAKDAAVRIGVQISQV